MLVMAGISKAFLGVVALDDATLQVMPGEVHAVIGQNGAGKSTLMKILNGVYRRDAGSILFQGTPVDFRSPLEAQAAGVSTIYQEINLVPYRSVAENVFMGRGADALGPAGHGAHEPGGERDPGAAGRAGGRAAAAEHAQPGAATDGGDCPRHLHQRTHCGHG